MTTAGIDPTPAGRLVHEIRDRWFTLNCAAQALPQVHHDPQRFTAIHEILLRQVQAMGDLLSKADDLIAEEEKAIRPSRPEMHDSTG